MATTLTNAFVKPAQDDTGDTFYETQADNVQRTNDHNHNGTNSELLTPTTQSIASGSWTAEGDDTFSQTIDVTSANSAFTYDAIGLEFRLSNGTVIYPTIEKVTSTTYKIFINDNTQTVTAVYSS